MCDVYKEAGFSYKKKKFTKGLNMGLPLQSLSKKDSQFEWKDWPSPIKELLSAVVSKEGHAESLLGHERTHYFLKKMKLNNAFYCQRLR